MFSVAIAQAVGVQALGEDFSRSLQEYKSTGPIVQRPIPCRYSVTRQAAEQGTAPGSKDTSACTEGFELFNWSPILVNNARPPSRHHHGILLFCTETVTLSSLAVHSTFLHVFTKL